MSKVKKPSPEVRERAVRKVLERGNEHPSRWATMQSITNKIGCTAEALRTYYRHKALQATLVRRSQRAIRDEKLTADIVRIWSKLLDLRSGVSSTY